MARRHTVNIIGTNLDSPRGYGWALDGRIVAETLKYAGFEVQSINSHFYWGEGFANNLRARAARELQGFRHRYMRKHHPQRDLNLFLERVPHQMFPAARHQVLIPNQEWFLDSWKKYLPSFDAIICKTHVAEEVFKKLNCRTFYSSFSSEDRRHPDSLKHREFLMVIGRRSGLAERILAIWAVHPEWPKLTLSGHRIPVFAALPNVRIIRDYISDIEIVRLQNEHLFHLAVTAAEGFGHKLNEGMSCGAIVITTDAPPMNELINPDRGFLVKWNKSNPKALGTEYHFDDVDLEAAIERCLKLTTEEANSCSTRARKWFETNDQFFKTKLPSILHEILEGK